jgi:hypothetical protein
MRRLTAGYACPMTAEVPRAPQHPAPAELTGFSGTTGSSAADPVHQLLQLRLL